MANFAVIENGIVENIIVCESKELAEQLTEKICIEYNDENPAYRGYGWDGEKFESPPIPEPEPSYIPEPESIPVPEPE
jgi:hypothetical protein